MSETLQYALFAALKKMRTKQLEDPMHTGLLTLVEEAGQCTPI